MLYKSIRLFFAETLVVYPASINQGVIGMKKYLIAGLTLILLTACNNTDKETVESSFPKVTKPYRFEQAIQNKDVVNLHGEYTNLDKWQQFIENVDHHQADKVRITQYTIEGDPILYELLYDGKIIHYTFDNSMDAFGSNKGRPSTSCEGIGTKKIEDGPEGYVLTECDNQTGDTFWFEGK